MANQTQITATPGGREVIITRVFDAPREKVWKAWTEPEIIKQWLGPKGYEMEIEQYNLQAGGSYRYIHTATDGNKYAFHGVFHGIHAPEKMIQTFEFEGLPEPGHVSLDTLILEAQDSKTTATTISVFQTVEDRDGMVQSGMEKGITEGYERLDEILAKA